ncbi:MAG: response regulator [Kofleriaceae bacterium]
MTSPSYVLVVEDDDAFREILTFFLERRGIRVVALANGALALAHLDQGNHPTAIVCDVMMPGVLGTTVAAYLRASEVHRDIPIAFTTADPNLVPKEYHVWLKPYPVQEILRFVQDAVKKAA